MGDLHMKFVWFKNIYAWNMTGIIGKDGKWFIRFSQIQKEDK